MSETPVHTRRIGKRFPPAVRVLTRVDVATTPEAGAAPILTDTGTTFPYTEGPRDQKKRGRTHPYD